MAKQVFGKINFKMNFRLIFTQIHFGSKSCYIALSHPWPTFWDHFLIVTPGFLFVCFCFVLFCFVFIVIRFQTTSCMFSRRLFSRSIIYLENTVLKSFINYYLFRRAFLLEREREREGGRERERERERPKQKNKNKSGWALRKELLDSTWGRSSNFGLVWE